MSQFYIYPAQSVTATNPSVGVNGTTAPGSSTEVGFINGSGNLTAVSPSTPLPVTIESGLANPLPTSDAADGVIGATAPADAIQTGGVDPSGNLRALHLDSNDYLYVDDQTPDYYQTDTLGALNATMFASVNGISSVTIEVTGTWNGQITVFGSVDDNVLAQLAIAPEGMFAPYNTVPISANGIYKVMTPGGYSRLELQMTAYTSGTAIIGLGATKGVNNVEVVQFNANNLNATVGGLGLVGTPAGGLLSVQGVVGAVPVPVAESRIDIAPASQNITIVDSGSTTTSQANGQVVITGAATMGSNAAFNSIGSQQSVEVEVTGTWTGTLSSELSFDNGNTWYTRGLKQSGSSYLATTFTQNFQGGANVTGVTNYRIRATSAMTGTAVVKVVFSLNEAAVVVSNPLTLRDSVTQSVQNTIKAASTAAVATDTALVVAISPNTPIAVGGALAQGSTTSGQLGNLSMGAVTTAAPSYTTGQTDPLSMDVNGNLRVIDNTEVANMGAIIPGAAGTKSGLAGMVYQAAITTPTDGEQLALQSDLFENLKVVQPDMLLTGATAQTATVSNILTNPSGTAATSVANYRSASVQIISTGTGGTFIFEGSNDNVNFQTIPVYSQLILTGTPIVAAITATASQLIYTFPVQVEFIRVRIATAITGGSIQAVARISQAPWTPAVMQIAQSTTANLNATTSTQLTAGGGTGSVNVGAVNQSLNLLVADVASAAITTTTTTATLTPTTGVAYTVNIPVTVVSGTNPTMLVSIQESSDTGTNWYTVYTFPLITTTGSYNSPMIMTTGNRIRYVQTITGSTPSFTRAINRLQSNTSAELVYKNLIDTSIVPSTTNSTTASVYVENTNTYTAIVNQGAGGSPVTFAMDGSDDDVNWIPAITTCVGIVGGTSPVTMFYNGANFRWVRVRVVTGVASATIVNISIIGSQGSNNPASASGMIVTQSNPANLQVTSTPVANPSVPLNGQVTSTGTAVVLGSGALVNGVIVQALAANTTNVYVGSSSVTSSNGFQLQPGQATSVAVANLSDVFIISTHSGDGICYIGS